MKFFLTIGLISFVCFSQLYPGRDTFTLEWIKKNESKKNLLPIEDQNKGKKPRPEPKKYKQPEKKVTTYQGPYQKLKNEKNESHW